MLCISSFWRPSSSGREVGQDRRLAASIQWASLVDSNSIKNSVFAERICGPLRNTCEFHPTLLFKFFLNAKIWETFILTCERVIIKVYSPNVVSSVYTLINSGDYCTAIHFYYYGEPFRYRLNDYTALKNLISYLVVSHIILICLDYDAVTSDGLLTLSTKRTPPTS